MLVMCHIAMPAGAQDTLSVAMPATAADSTAADSVCVADKAEADSAYAREQFAQAARLYAALIAQNGESAEVYYNLGNCYYRQDSMAKAILYYERARLLDPADADIRLNLDLARSKTIDKVVPQTELFFVTAYHKLVLSLSQRSWAVCGWLTFALMLAMLGVYLFVPRVALQKGAFAVAVAALVVCIFANVAAFNQRSHIRNRNEAIIMAPSAVVKSTPSSGGTDLFILHEGTHVTITDASMQQWVEIRMADGKAGWLERNTIDVI
jgi:tetratricopeptide (TPR) repeat protein